MLKETQTISMINPLGVYEVTFVKSIMVGLDPEIIKSQIYRNFVNNTHTTSHMIKIFIILKETKTVTMLNPSGVHIWSDICKSIMIGMDPGIIKSKIHQTFVNNTGTTSHMIFYIFNSFKSHFMDYYAKTFRVVWNDWFGSWNNKIKNVQKFR